MSRKNIFISEFTLLSNFQVSSSVVCRSLAANGINADHLDYNNFLVIS